MNFYVKQDGLVIMLSTDNKLYFQIEQEKLSEETKLRYQYLLDKKVLRFTYPSQESYIPLKDMGIYISNSVNENSRKYLRRIW